MAYGVAEVEGLSRRAPRRPLPTRMHVGPHARPIAALVLGMLLVALGAGWIAAHVSTFSLDETLMQQSALHYASGLPHSLLHDPDARATDRLYSLVLSIAYRISGGPEAIRLDHVLSTLLFVSAAIPLFLVARIALRSPWAAVAVALLGICAPWLAITSALFTENLSYPLFWWMILATSYAVWRPLWWHDAVAVLSIALLVVTRVQFAAVFPGYLLAVACVSLWRVAPGERKNVWSAAWHRLRGAAREWVRCYAVSILVLLAALAVVAYVRSLPNWQTHVETLFGTYSNVLIRHSLPPNMIEGLLVELIALALGVGLLPALVSIPWYFRTLSHPRAERRWVLLLSMGVVLIVFLTGTVFAQGGYLGPITEERYFFYVAPVFWLGAFAVLEDRQLGAREIVVCALALAGLYAVIPFLSPLSSDTAFLAPVESVVPHVLEQRFTELGLSWLTVQEALAVIVLLAGIVTAVIWRRWRRARVWWVIAGGVVVQLLITGYAFAVIDGKVQGIAGRTGGSLSELGWVNGHARSSAVVWLDNGELEPPSAAASLAVDRMRSTLFWNSDLTSWASLAQLALPVPEWPMTALPAHSPLQVNLASGTLGPATLLTGMREAVSAAGSPLVQLAGTTLARSPEHALTLISLQAPVRASWLALGLQPEGRLLSGPPVHVYAFSPSSATTSAEAITLTFAPPALPAPAAAAQALVSLTFGGATRTLAFAAGAAPRQVRVMACFAPRQTALAGSMRVVRPIDVAGTNTAGMLTSVSLTPAPSSSACS